MDNLQDMIDSIERVEEQATATNETCDETNVKQNKICKKCHQQGHFANKCPVVIDKRKAKLKCHICGQSGHNRNSCPGIDDDGKAQSTFKGNSTSKNNTGEKKKKGKDKVRAQKMMRVKKKERGQSIDEKESKAIVYPETSNQFYDLLIDHLSPSEDPRTCRNDLLAGFVSNVCVSSDKSYVLSFSSLLPADTPGLLGYAIGIPPEYSTLWLSHIDLNCGEDIILRDILGSAGSNLIAIAHIGLDYREQTICHNSVADQIQSFQKQIDMLNSVTMSRPKYLFLKAVAGSAAPSPDSVFKTSQSVEEELNIDKDFSKVLVEAEFLREQYCDISIVLSLADCGLQFQTISALIQLFPNLYFSLDGRLTHSKQKLIKEYAFDIPLSRIVFATMSPRYPVASSCLDGISVDSSTSSSILFIAEVLSSIKNLTLDEVLEKCYENSKDILLKKV